MKKQKRDLRTPREKKLHIVKWILTIALVSAAFLSTGYLIWAKYYSQSSKQGMAIASGIYFTANFAGEVATEDAEPPESVVLNNYSGTSTTYTFEVRNYENNLLFNGDGMEIDYDIYFWMEENPAEEGVSYSVTNETTNEDAKPLAGTSSSAPISFTGNQIGGGSAIKQNYRINIVVENEAISHKPLPVYVMVKTKDNAIIHKILKGKMTMTTSSAGAESFVQTSGFQYPIGMSQQNKFDTEIKPALQKSAGLTYEIQTVGRVLNSEQATRTIRVRWLPDEFDIDLYDSNYLKWKSDNSKTAPDTMVIGEVTWNYFTVSVMPYSSEEIIFYPRKDLDWNTITTMNTTDKGMENLNSHIQAEDITVTTTSN